MEKKGEKSDKEEYIRWFSELSNKDIKIAGGKGASLAEMYNHKFPVPPAFIITAQAFDYFLIKNGIKERIKEIIESIETEDTKELEKKSKEIRALIEDQEMPEDLKREIIEGYHILGTEKINKIGISNSALNLLKNSYEPIFVSIRSSATAEDLANASFAGQQESFLNVKGDRNLIEYVKRCFSSLFTPRAIYYRHKKGFDKVNTLLAVVVQKMIDSEKSGVIFSKDPTNQSEDIIIEAAYGLGEGVVSGRVNPDNYTISRELEVKNVKIGDKKVAITRDSSGRNTIVKLSPEKSKTRVLSNGKLIELANYALRLEEHYEKPQDIEFAIEEDKIYIVQSRPITTLGERKIQKEISGTVLLTGQGASPGIGVGVVRIIKNLADLDKIKKGDILVTEMTNPDMVVSMQRSVAIVTDEGGLTSHAAIVSREMGIPAVIGTGKATSLLQDGMRITVDGATGKVYEGEVAETTFAEVKPAVKTEKIKIKLILDLPEFAERAAQSEIDGVGLLRLEGIIASSGKHPLYYEKENRLGEYEEVLRRGIEKISSHFNLIWVRTSDIRTDEFDLLKGAPKKELNPMLGFHGIRFSLKHPKILEAEIMAISKVAEKHSHKTFGVMIPQLISVEEVIETKKHFEKHKKHNMVFGVMIETPASVQIIEDICKKGINFISFGTNDLTQFTLALDRGNEHVQYLYNELHPAIFSQIKKVIETCKRYNVETSICGQAGSRKEMAEFLFKNGIDSISVNADAAHDISILIKQLEEESDSKFINRVDEETASSDSWNPSSLSKDNEEKSENSKFDNEKSFKEDDIEFEIGRYIDSDEKKHEIADDSSLVVDDRTLDSLDELKLDELKIQELDRLRKEDEKLLHEENIKIAAELEEEFDNLKHLKEKAEKVQHEVWHENQEEMKRERKIEEGIEVEKIEDEGENQQAPKFNNIFDEGTDSLESENSKINEEDKRFVNEIKEEDKFERKISSSSDDEGIASSLSDDDEGEAKIEEPKKKEKIKKDYNWYDNEYG